VTLNLFGDTKINPLKKILLKFLPSKNNSVLYTQLYNFSHKFKIDPQQSNELLRKLILKKYSVSCGLSPAVSDLLSVSAAPAPTPTDPDRP
jgi:hypothetical protein